MISDDEKDRIIIDLTHEVARLNADNERLRGLISHPSDDCHWCGVWMDTPHSPTCPAFTPEGEVK